MPVPVLFRTEYLFFIDISLKNSNSTFFFTVWEYKLVYREINVSQMYFQKYLAK